SMCGIADDKGVESLAGIMGGEATGCSAATTDVLIESALWDAANIAETGRKLGVSSDARYRFERGVDPAFTVPGLELATAMVLDLCGGEPSEITVAGKGEVPVRSIEFPVDEIPRLAGLAIEADEVAGVLRRLGFTVGEPAGGSRTNGAVLHVGVPSWRADIEG